ncbi:MAG: carboxypeptidase regulatory-like domain-containing protein [Thermoanaerobaculia bacterium]
MNRFVFRKLVVLGVVAVLATAGLAVAQDDTGNVFVTATDSEGNKLPGATVTLDCGTGDQIQITDSAGLARFLGLDPGNCSLVVSLDGFSTVEFPAVNVRVAQNTSVEAQLSAAVEETITVTSESPLLDSRRISQQTTISQVELEKIPTARDPWSVLTQTPGVMVDRINVGGNESGQQSSFVGPGVSDDENAFLVDGVEITDMAAVGASSTYYDFDQFTEMQFQTGGTDVTKSGAGVAVNLVTKRGTNEFRGSARFLRTGDMFDTFSQTAVDIQAPNNDLGPNQTRFIGNSINEITDYGVEAGGPALRDKLWFWGSFGTNDIKNLTGGSSPSAVQEDNTILENTAFKVNAQFSGNNSAVGSWNNGNKRKFGRNASPTRPAPTTWNQRGPSAIIKFEDTHVFSSSFFLGGTWAKVDGGFSLFCKACGTSPDSLAQAPETTWTASGIWENGYISGSSSRPSEEVKLDGNYFFNTGNTNHEIKFGTRLRDFEAESPFHWPGRDIFVVDLGVFGVPGNLEYVVAHRGETPLITQEYTSIWAQDTISSGNWTLNVGFRYDLQEGFNEPFQIAANPAFPDLLPAVSHNGIDPGFDWETISPRVGVTYALGEEKKTLLRASFAQFPEQLSTGNLDDVNPLGDAYGYYLFTDENENLVWDEGVDTFIGLDSANNFDPSDPGAAVSPNRIDSGLDAPITDEILVSVEHALLPEFVVGLSATWRDTSDHLFTRDLLNDNGNIRPATVADYAPDGTVSGSLPQGGSYNVPVFALQGERTGGTLLQNSDRSVEYLGYGVNWIKRLSNQWMLRGYFNFGDADWSLGPNYLNESDPNDAEGGFDNQGGLFAVQAAGSGAKQDVFVQSSWQANVNGMYQVAPDRPWGFNVAANVFLREGTPLPYYSRSRLSDGLRRDIQVTSAVDTFRSDDVETIDLRLEKEFAPTGNVGFTVSLDAFNLLDENFVMQRRRQTNSSAFDNVTETLSPRVWRLGVRLNWR